MDRGTRGDFNTTNDLDEDDEIMIYIPRALAAARIETDSIMLMQVISYLLSYALRTSLDGTPIKLKCRHVGNSLVIEVHNTSTIPTDDKERLFVPYLKGENETRNDGLGLYLCALYMEALGGTIDTSCENNITVFTITLPGAIHCDQKFTDA